mmetsp:Transcript_20266/g.34165  ORF Transcript_20266/g.34165 Transcript_20266/m.34165 type:complete len:315 (+) Transcript_20266:106-1050(+)
MKIGVQDASISYEVAEPQTGKKKFIRRTYTGQSTSSSTNLPVNKKATHVERTRPPKLVINTRVGYGDKPSSPPKSAVRFNSNADRAVKTSSPPKRRIPSSPLNRTFTNSQGPESAIQSRPVTPNRSVKVYGEEPRFPVTSFRQEYQNDTPIPTITRVRKEIVHQDVEIPWNRSCNPPNRDTLLVEEYMKKNLRDQKIQMTQNTGLRPRSAPAAHKKTLPDSYARNRNSKTNGPILNLPYSELRRNAPPKERNIHERRWNCQTKDRDDEERAKPENGKDTSLHAMYTKENCFYRRNRPVTGGAINRTREFSQVLR